MKRFRSGRSFWRDLTENANIHGWNGMERLYNSKHVVDLKSKWLELFERQEIIEKDLNEDLDSWEIQGVKLCKPQEIRENASHQNL